MTFWFRHHHDHHWPLLEARLGALEHTISLILENTRTIMSKADELKAALDDLATELADNNTEIEALLTKITAPGTSDADVDAAVARIRSLISDNKAEVDKAKAATG